MQTSNFLTGVGLALLSAAAAQTFTDCDPTNKTCPSDKGLRRYYYDVDFTRGASKHWNMTSGSASYDKTSGVTYTISQSGDAPTMQTNFYVFFGEISVVMKTAKGTGIVSCAILESDDLDEIDWEWLGGNATSVQTNYFGKGNTSTYDRGKIFNMTDAQAEFHTYTIVWTKEKIKWKIDGKVVRTLAYADALGGRNYPQTPMRVKLGIWAGGDLSNSPGTVAWAGGVTNYTKGPFKAHVKSVSIVNYNPTGWYTYNDTSGTYDSIVIGGSKNTTSFNGTDLSTESNSGTSGSSVSNGTLSFTNSTSNSTSSSSSSGSASMYSASSTTTSTRASTTATLGGAPSWGPKITWVIIVVGTIISLFLEF